MHYFDEDGKLTEYEDVFVKQTPAYIKQMLLTQGLTALVDPLRPNAGDRVVHGQRVFSLLPFTFVNNRTYGAINPGYGAATVSSQSAERVGEPPFESPLI